MSKNPSIMGINNEEIDDIVENEYQKSMNNPFHDNNNFIHRKKSSKRTLLNSNSEFLICNLVEGYKIKTRFKSKAKTCGICYEAIENQGIIDTCNHEFCFSCIEKWSNTENSCPLCKQRFSKIKNIWRRPYYNDTPKKKFCAIPPSEEIEIPTRDQNLNLDITNIQNFLSLVLTIFPINLENQGNLITLPNINADTNANINAIVNDPQIINQLEILILQSINQMTELLSNPINPDFNLNLQSINPN